jgi:multiple sugar transport system permease protein
MAVATATRRSVGTARSRTLRTRAFGYLLLTPALLYILGLVAVPFFLALWFSVSNVTVTNQTGTFVGLKNFADLLRDPAFKTALRNTFVYTLLSTIINSFLGTFLAFILLSNFPGKRVIRFLILLPWTIPIALTILSWKWMFDSQYSVLNWIGINSHLYALIDWVNLHLPGDHSHYIRTNTLQGVQWLGRPLVAMGAVIAVNVWRNFPFAAIVLLAGLTSIPPEIIDAARIDGARAWTRYTKIVVPMIAPILFIGLLFNVIFTTTDLTIVYLLTQGGPANATLVLGVRAFQVGIGSGDLSHGAATTLFLFPVLFVFAIIFLRQLRRREI